MKLLLVGSVSYLGLAVLAWFIGGVWVGDVGKTEIVYVPEPHVVQEVVHDRVEVPVYITPEPIPSTIPAKAPMDIAPRLEFSVTPTPTPVLVILPVPEIGGATVRPTVTPAVLVTPCNPPGNGQGKAVGWRRRNC